MASVKPSQGNCQPPIHQGGLKKSHFNREFELEYKSNITALEPLKTASDCPLCELIVATSSLGQERPTSLVSYFAGINTDLSMSQMQTIGVTLETRQGKVAHCRVRIPLVDDFSFIPRFTIGAEEGKLGKNKLFYFLLKLTML